MYHYKIFNSITDECQKLWESTDNNSVSTFFQNIDYIKKLIQNKNNKIKIIVIYSNNEILTILPLEIKKYFFINVLQWIGTEYGDYCNPILSNKFDSTYDKNIFFNTWLKILKEIGKIDQIFFNNQLATINNTINPFVDCFKTSLFSKIYNAEFKGEFEDYKKDVKKIDKKHFYEVHRTLLKLDKLNQLSKVSMNVKDSFHDTLDFRNIIKEKRNQLQKKNIYNKLDNGFVELFEHLIDLKKINFYILSLKLKNQDISKCFGFVYKNTFYYYIPTISSNSFDNFKPGKILITQIIKWCIANKIKKLDFGLGSEKYKKYFSNKKIYLHRYLSFLSFKGFIAYLLISIVFRIKRL